MMSFLEGIMYSAWRTGDGNGMRVVVHKRAGCGDRPKID